MLSAAFVTGWISGSRCPFPSFSRCCRGRRKSCSPEGWLCLLSGCCPGQRRKTLGPDPCLHLLSWEAMPVATSGILHSKFPSAPICSPRGAPGEDRDPTSPARPLKVTAAPSSSRVSAGQNTVGTGKKPEQSDLSPGWAGSDLRLPALPLSSPSGQELPGASLGKQDVSVCGSLEPRSTQGSPRAALGWHGNYPSLWVMGELCWDSKSCTCNRV